ncbi:hypothetical protein FA95DRAFT_1608747 [Auriscalpium vulgare]|uniref:Uncharacterized protein n=1 Tax=Auriscalpium vulgare TaxID=40419 RepID=A0ACB8RKZ4_9AGAM|nr:hypothetical protein FA95DRAFT_1608747 [Auriscalpium vulgare]
MTRVTVTVDVPTEDLAERLANLTINFSPKKSSKDGNASSAASAKSANASGVAYGEAAVPNDASVPGDGTRAKSEPEEQEPWDGEAWVIFKGVGPGVYRVDSEEFTAARGVSRLAKYKKFPTYKAARKAFDEAKRRGETRPYSRGWDKKTEHGMPS